jgi:DNA-binding transcriptional LysR family regulator
LISRQLPPRETREGLSGGELDCALGFLAEPGEGMFQRLLFRERYVLMARADHPRVREGMSLADVRRETFACISHGGSGHDGVLDVLRSREVGVTVLLELGQFSAAPRIVAETDLIIVVPSRLGASLNIATPVKLVTPPFALPELAIKLYWHERSHNEAGNRWLRELIGTLFANDGAAKHVPPGA